MGLFSRKKRDELPERPMSSKDIHDSFEIYVEEAKFVGEMFGLDFSEMGPHQKVFAFLGDNPSCIALIVFLGDSLHLIRSDGADLNVTEIFYRDISASDILDNYEGPLLHDERPDSDNSPVRHLRTPRLAMSLVSTEVDTILVAHKDQMEFVETYMQGMRMFNR